MREGKLRAQGAFQHPILAGTFGATLLPLMVGLMRMKDRGLRRIGVLGTGCAFVGLRSSEQWRAPRRPSRALAPSLLWRMRRSMHLVLLGVVVLLVVLQVGMSRPVWWIFDTIGDLTGGEGWHRSYIIDAAIRHFDEWWLAGTPVTVHWGGYPPPPNDPNNIDLTNQFLVEAVGGGSLRLGLFLAILWTCFRGLGRAFRARRGSIHPDTEWLAWTTGVALLCPLRLLLLRGLLRPDDLLFLLARICDRRGHPGAGLVARRSAGAPLTRRPRRSHAPAFWMALKSSAAAVPLQRCQRRSILYLARGNRMRARSLTRGRRFRSRACS